MTAPKVTGSKENGCVIRLILRTSRKQIVEWGEHDPSRSVNLFIFFLFDVIKAFAAVNEGKSMRASKKLNYH